MFAENLALKLISLITTVLILGAVYLFIVKPVLDTTTNAFNSVNGTVQNAFDGIGVNGVSASQIKNGNFGDIQKQLQQSGLNSQQQQQAEKLLSCIQRVQPDTTKMQACTERFN